MSKNNINIIIVETSPIIYEGINAILTHGDQHFTIHFTYDLTELQQLQLRIKPNFVLINPILIQNKKKEYRTLKKECDNTLWIGIVYSFLDYQLLSLFDDFIYINDSPNKIITSIQNLYIVNQQDKNQPIQQEVISEREIEVLKLLVEGNANKEIADKLNISTHTVISHRKNISQKTGIKSVAGLTIYAVVNNIIAIDNYIN